STDSRTIAAPCFVDQLGSEYERVTRCAPSSSAHSGLIAATSRAHNREVSTSSPAMAHAGGLRTSAEPGQIANLTPRAPRYSPRGLRLLSDDGAPLAVRPTSVTSSCPSWESRPERRDTWMRSASHSRRRAPVTGCPVEVRPALV